MNRSARGSATIAVLAVTFVVCIIFFFTYFLSKPKDHSHARKPAAELSPRQARLDQLDGELFQLLTTLSDVETLRDRHRYLEVAGAASKKLTEADELWDQESRFQKGLVNGMMSGMSENYESRFTREDKLGMLSEKYGVPVERLRALKADLEILFWDELADKFVPVEPAGDEQQH